MRKLLPYPALIVGLVLMWLLLTSFTRGQFVLAVLVSVGAAHALTALGEVSPSVRRWMAIPELLGIVFYDVAASNLSMARTLLSRRRDRRSGFVVVPVRLTNTSALAILAIVLTSTPGTAWIDYNAARGELLIHVFDLSGGNDWKDIIANRYERLLMEIFR